MSGLLGQVFSAGNVARRKLTDLLGNPVLSAQQIVGNLNDRARVLNEMTSAAAQEGVNYGPASRQLAGLLAEAYNPVGMISKVAPKSIDEIAKKYPNVIIDASVNKNDINLSRIVVPKEMRNQGIGTQVMTDLSNFADSIGKRITLTPSGDFGGNVPKLKTFYKELGFVENKGKNKDFSTREAMYREPQAVQQSTQFEYPQEEALRLAQQRAALPIEQGGLGLPPSNTAMDRAKAMGFRTKDKLYHGTPEQDIKEFVPTPHDETAILGTSLTSDPTIAEFYARGRGFSEQEGANILPVMIRGKKPQDFEKFTDYLINKNLLNDRTRQLTPEAKKYLESKGISGFDMSSLYGDEVQVVDPSRIRSIFAAFDPARRNEADILAGVLPLSLLADEEQRKKADAYFRSLLGQ